MYMHTVHIFDYKCLLYSATGTAELLEHEQHQVDSIIGNVSVCVCVYYLHCACAFTVCVCVIPYM